MKKNLSKIISRSNEQQVVEITQKHYEADLQRGLTEDETLRPGKYLVRRGRFFDNHPELKSPQRATKARVTMLLDQDIVDSFKRAAEAENALPYQTQINLVLRKYLQEQSLSLAVSDQPTIQALAKAIAQELQSLSPQQK